jgi:hypothetical protein
MYIEPRMIYKGNMTKGSQRWIKIYRGKWFLMKNYKLFWRRPRELSLLIMIMS